MTDVTARSRTDTFMMRVPYVALILSLLLVWLGEYAGIPHQPWPVILLIAVFTLGWLFWWVDGHPRWVRDERKMLVFFGGLAGLIFALVWCSPLFGFFAWAGYIPTSYALRGRWRIAGGTLIGTANTFSQIGGFSVAAEPDAWPVFVAVLALNVGVGNVMIWITVANSDQSARRAVMIDDLAEANAKLEAALRENAGLHAQLLVQAREAGKLDERQRMAGEIHDVLAQGLTGIVTQLEAADAASTRPDDHRRHLDTARKLARDSLAEARRSVHALRPRTLDDAALPDAIGEVAAGWSRITAVPVEMVTTGTARPLLPEIETTLLRTAQEALANVARHAGAGRVTLTLSYMEDLVMLDVHDDGAGFDPDAPREPGAEGGYGLTAMRERLHRIAGRLEVESEQGGGTALSACVPAIAIGTAA